MIYRGRKEQSSLHRPNESKVVGKVYHLSKLGYQSGTVKSKSHLDAANWGVIFSVSFINVDVFGIDIRYNTNQDDLHKSIGLDELEKNDRLKFRSFPL